MTMLKLIVSILSIGLSSSLQSHLYARSPRWSELSATTAADIASKSSHTIMKIPPVRALMLTTAWKNDAENLRALGYTTKDTTDTIVQKSSAADVLSKMQRWANQLTFLSKQEHPELPEGHPLKEVLEGMEVLCAISTKMGTALAFYKISTEADGTVVVSIEACVGNLALGTNEVAEEALVRHIISEAKKGALRGVVGAATVRAVTCKARAAPSGSTYLPPFYSDLGFQSVAEKAEEDRRLVEGGPGTSDDAGPPPEVVMGWGGAEKTGFEKIGWGGMWTEAEGEEKLLFRLAL